MEIAQDGDLADFLWNLSQVENNFKIKSPLLEKVDFLFQNKVSLKYCSFFLVWLLLYEIEKLFQV